MSSSSGVKQNAFAISGQNQALAQQASGTALPLYQQLAQGNQGFTPQQSANMLTASGQSLGGGQAAAVGQGALMQARTGNAGGYASAIDDAARQAGVQQSQNALGIQDQSAMLAHQNQLAGLQGLSGLNAQGTQGAISALNTANSAQQPFWKSFAQRAGMNLLGG